MAGNWKMNPATEQEALDLARALTSLLGDETCAIDDSDDMCTEVVVFPPHPFISKVKDIAEEAGITVGAQSIFFEDKGAYTGSVAASMVQSIGCEYVLCGHSERRTLFRDDDLAINKKVHKVLSKGMKPILCIGETKEEYDLNIKVSAWRKTILSTGTKAFLSGRAHSLLTFSSPRTKSVPCNSPRTWWGSPRNR
jgi:triosephosphate isomerase